MLTPLCESGVPISDLQLTLLSCIYADHKPSQQLCSKYSFFTFYFYNSPVTSLSFLKSKSMKNALQLQHF